MNENQPVCLKCGVPEGVGNSFCANCGSAVASPDAIICVNCGVALSKKFSNNASVNNDAIRNIQKRDLVKAIILSIVTCGIYGIYWFVKLTDELNAMTNHQHETSGGMCFLLSIVTCGIYTYYWAYKMGVKKAAREGNTTGSSPILYIALTFFGLGIVAYALIQDAMNKAIDKASF